MKKTVKFIRWIVTNAAFSYCLYLAISEKNIGAIRLSEFAIWIFFFASLFTLNDDFVRDVQKKNGLPVQPAWLEWIYDATILGFMVWSGWIWCSIAYLIQSVFIMRLREKLPPKEPPEPDFKALVK